MEPGELINYPATLAIFLATLAISLYALYRNQSLYYGWIMEPYKVVHKNKWHTLITSGFIHADLMHLIFNIIALYIFGFYLELLFFIETGSHSAAAFYFILVYFGSMILADLPIVFKKKEDIGYGSVGASGAISGVILSFIFLRPEIEITPIFFPIPLPGIVFGAMYLSFSYFASKRQFDNVNHEAHYWGALAGLVITIILMPSSVQNFINRISNIF